MPRLARSSFLTSYLAALSRMEKQFAKDPVLSVMVVPEMERNLAGAATKALTKVEWKRVSSFLTKPTLKFKHANKR